MTQPVANINRAFLPTRCVLGQGSSQPGGSTSLKSSGKPSYPHARPRLTVASPLNVRHFAEIDRGFW
jgi:hypothetical protein